MIDYIRKKLRLRRWRRKGCPLPPPHVVKEECVMAHAKQFGLRTLVETGTFHGEMIEWAIGRFDTIYSIELDDALYAAAAKKFAGRTDVKLLHGDSGEMIGKVLASLKTPALFWLDAHYSGDGTAHGPLETPIIAEMKQVLDHPVKGHVVLIDDARFFDGTEDYPTLQQVEQLVSTFSSKCRFEVLHDVIRVTPA